MDLANINVASESEEGAVFLLVHPVTDMPITGERSSDVGSKSEQMYIRFAGRFSERYTKQQRALTDRRLKKAQGKRKVTVSADQIEMEEAETLARCVIEGFVIVDGKTVENSFDAWYALFMDSRFRWLTDAASEFLTTDENFTKKS